MVLGDLLAVGVVICEEREDYGRCGLGTSHRELG